MQGFGLIAASTGVLDSLLLLRVPLELDEPYWVEDEQFDLEYHVRHAALPWPGGERELGELVGRLQSTPLDLMRPPWECTLIEGLEGHRFAMFIKMHHSLIDGISGMKLLQRAMSTDRKRSLDLPPFWASGTAPASRAGKEPAPAPTMANAAEAAVAALSGQARSLPQLAASLSISPSASDACTATAVDARVIMCSTLSSRPQCRPMAAPMVEMSRPRTANEAPSSVMPGSSGSPGSFGGAGFIRRSICWASSGKWYRTTSRPRFCSMARSNTTSAS